MTIWNLHEHAIAGCLSTCVPIQYRSKFVMGENKVAYLLGYSIYYLHFLTHRVFCDQEFFHAF